MERCTLCFLALINLRPCAPQATPPAELLAGQCIIHGTAGQCWCRTTDDDGTWDLSVLAGTQVSAGVGGDYWFDLCGNVSPVLPPCADLSINAAQAVRIDGGFCNQLGPGFADPPALPTADTGLTISRRFFGDIRFRFRAVSASSGARRSLEVNLFCDRSSRPGVRTLPGEVSTMDGSSDNVGLRWGTPSICEPGWGVPVLAGLGA